MSLFSNISYESVPLYSYEQGLKDLLITTDLWKLWASNKVDVVVEVQTIDTG